MSINIDTNNNFYVAKEKISTYANNDEKVLAKEETIKDMFGTEENVLVTISENGFAAAIENKYTRNPDTTYETEEQKAERANKNKLFQEEIKTLAPLVGIANDYDEDMDEVLKAREPKVYQEMKELLAERGKTSDEARQIEIGHRMIELMKRARSVLHT